MLYLRDFYNINENNTFEFRPFNGENIYDLENDNFFHKYFYSTPTDKEIIEFKKWLNKHKDDYVFLYHGTGESVSKIIDKEGIKKTTNKTKKSYQTQTGFVYLSIFKDMAKSFGDFAYPYDKPIVYKVYIKIKELKPDKDQLYNKRLYTEDIIEDNLAHSLIYGHGARTNRNLFLYEIEKLSE